MFCENCGHQISDTAKFCSACGHPVGTAPSPGVGAPPTVPAKRESPRLKASSGNGSISRMSGIRRKPWLLRMPIPDPHTGITVVKTVGTYVTREEAEAVRAEMMKRPATPYQDSTLAKIHEVFLESREYKGRSDKARELYDLAWKYLKPLWYYKIAALYAQDFQNILDKMADDGLSQSMLEKERTLISKLYRTAIGWRVVDANLASVLKIEGRKSPEREIFTDEQVTLILSQKNTPTGQMVIALLACGVRIYELLHFKHEDFHRTESGAYLIGGCKTEAGRNRIIPILDFGPRRSRGALRADARYAGICGEAETSPSFCGEAGRKAKRGDQPSAPRRLVMPRITNRVASIRTMPMGRTMTALGMKPAMM